VAPIDWPPRGVLKALLRAPIVIFRVGLGRLLGRRFLYVVHTGRRTGRTRETVLEVVGYDRSIPEVFVVSAWGERSDWYRNLTAASAVEIRVGSRRWFGPQHRVLDTEETVRLLEVYRARHRYAWRALAPMLGLPADTGHPAFRGASAKIRSLAFTPRRT
jgi:deazaflavin-dependent oxidoreductase (nitroreductase family)